MTKTQRNRIDMLLTVISGKIPYGTILSVTREHKSKKHWITTEAETNKPYLVNKKDVKEI